MPRDKLVPYWMRLHSKKKPGLRVHDSDYFDLTDLSGENNGFSSWPTIIHYLIEKFRELRDVGHKDGEFDKTLTVRQFDHAGPGDPESSDNGHTIEAVLSYGRYGRPEDHIEAGPLGDPSTSPDELREEGARGRNTAGEVRLYLLFHLSASHPRRGIMIFHKYGNNSAKSALYKFLNEPLHEAYDCTNTDTDQGLVFDITTVASKSMVDQLIEDTFTGFEVVQRNIPSEAYAQESNILGNTRDTKITYSIETEEYTLDREGANNLLSRVQSSDYPYAEILQPTGDEDSVSRVNALVKTTDGDSRKRRLTQNRLSVEEFINEDLDYDDEGYPLMTSIAEMGREMANGQLSSYNDPTLNTVECLLQ